jgi:hypothetical protein
MMQNLQLTIQNVHISYETKSTTKLGHPFSFGITIHSLQMAVNRFLRLILKSYSHLYLDNNE